MVLFHCADRSSGRNTKTNPRKCPWCPSRAAPDLRTWGRWYSQTRAWTPAAILLRQLVSDSAEAAPVNPYPARQPFRPVNNKLPELACPNTAAAKFPSLGGGRWSPSAQTPSFSQTSPSSQSVPRRAAARLPARAIYIFGRTPDLADRAPEPP